jgi:hypothetical protein
MTVINIQMVFLDRCRNNGRSRVRPGGPEAKPERPIYSTTANQSLTNANAGCVPGVRFETSPELRKIAGRSILE